MSSPRPTSRPRRRGGVLRWTLLALIVLFFIEVVALVLVGRAIGIWWTLGLLFALTVLGVWLVRRETSRTYRALREAVTSGRLPADEVTDAILVMVGGFLLVLPGFVSDVIGLLLMLPFTRPVARRLFQAVVGSRAAVVVAGPGGPDPAYRPRGGAGQVIEGELVSEQPPPGREGGTGPGAIER